jgi:DNA-binding MarR family transcriptional regulator
MKRDTLLTRLENSMFVIGKGIHDEVSHDTGCSPAQNHTLIVIGMQPADMGIKQLAEVLRVTSGAATQHVDALEKAGLLVREMNQQNRREVFVKITGRGKKVYQELRRAKSKILNEIFTELTDKELDTLVQLIEKVSHKYVNVGKESHGEIQQINS